VVTGAGGFIGSTVSRVFLGAGWHVTGVVRRRAVHPESRQAGLQCVVTDLRECTELPKRYDALVHCAAEVPAYCPDEQELVHSNVEGTRCILLHAQSAGARCVVYMSSMAAYGRVSVPVVDEATEPDAPDAYGWSKAAGEALLDDWARRTGGAGVSIRLPGVVGAGGRNNFLCDAYENVIAAQPVRARNPDAMFNNVIHVRDLASFVIALFTTMSRGHEILTIAARDAISIREVLAQLYSAAKREQQIIWEDGGRAPFVISFDRALALGYQPATVVQSIRRFVADAWAERPCA